MDSRGGSKCTALLAPSAQRLRPKNTAQAPPSLGPTRHPDYAHTWASAWGQGHSPHSMTHPSAAERDTRYGIHACMHAHDPHHGIVRLTPRFNAPTSRPQYIRQGSLAPGPSPRKIPTHPPVRHGHLPPKVYAVGQARQVGAVVVGVNNNHPEAVLGVCQRDGALHHRGGE